MGTATLLSVSDLSIEFDVGDQRVRAIDRVSFEVGRAERVGLVGESGAGKTVVALAIVGLIPRPGRVVSGSVVFDVVDIARASDAALTKVRGRRISLIPQDASLALNPVLTIGRQMQEVLEQHTRLRRAEIDQRCHELLRRVRLADPARILRAFAGELSGGMKQRVGIAMALLCEPELVIADDPTSAVDVTIAAQILRELRDLTARMGVSVLFISHDLRVVSTLCSRVIVLYAGQVSEIMAAAHLVDGARHPYTAALLNCAPTIDVRRSPLPTVPGPQPDSVTVIDGCRFHPRCPNRVGACSETYPALAGDDHRLACWNPLSPSRAQLGTERLG